MGIFTVSPEDDGRILTGCSVQQVQVLSYLKRSRREFIAAARRQCFDLVVCAKLCRCAADSLHLRQYLGLCRGKIHISLCIPVVSGIPAAVDTVIYADSGWIHFLPQIYGQVRLGRNDRIDFRSSNVAWCTVGAPYVFP